MRARNVKALAALLEEAVEASAGGHRLITRSIGGDAGHPVLSDPVRLAEWLVEAGAVLVPDAVTEQEALDLMHRRPAAAFARVTEESEGHCLREELRHIASDRPTGSRDTDGEATLCLKGTHRWGPAPEPVPTVAPLADTDVPTGGAAAGG